MVRFRIQLEPFPDKQKTIPSSIKILAFNITEKCNLKCPHCFAEDNRHEMNTEECKEILRQAKKSNCVRVILCGKEPLMRKDIFEILNYIKELGMDIELMTNGILIDQSVLDRLKNVGVSRVLFPSSAAHIDFEPSICLRFAMQISVRAFSLALMKLGTAITA